MKAPAIAGAHSTKPSPDSERGVTMVLVAIAMVGIIAMAALSIDVITLYLAREETQRAADAAALTAARVISVSGITGDPANSSGKWNLICGGSSSPASLAAVAAVQQNAVEGTAIAASSITVTYSAGNDGTIVSNQDCSQLQTSAFGVNPMVTVQLTSASVPTFFSRIWGGTGNTVNATAAAEAFNSSNSGNVGNVVTGTITPVQPRCVKPWIIPNRDPLTPAPVGGKYCDQTLGKACLPLVSTSDGSIKNQGISLNGTNVSGAIGERIWIAPDCIHTGASCSLRVQSPQGNYYASGHQAWLQPPPSMQYLPGDMSSTSSVAVPSCSVGSAYRQAIGGCDQGTVYACGVQLANQVDVSENPSAGTDDTRAAVTCLIHEGDATDKQPDGQDTLVGVSGDPFGSPNTNNSPSQYPFQVLAGKSNPWGLTNGSPVTSSPSIVSLPIYDDTNPSQIRFNGSTTITIIGFLQVFVNYVDQWGNVDVTILNVVGCGNGNNPTSGTPVLGSSPVPVRLITPPSS
jgi:Flp pilus assembly protein TadG